MEYEELYAAGCVGLVKAVDRFEPERGLCFSTYAVPVILGEIRRLFRDGGSVKISRSLKELSVKAARLRDQLSANGEPRISDIAQALGVTPEEAAEALCAGIPPVSLDHGGEDGEPLPGAVRLRGGRAHRPPGSAAVSVGAFRRGQGDTHAEVLPAQDAVRDRTDPRNDSGDGEPPRA